MKRDRHDETGLEGVIARLEAERPVPSAVELDRMKRRAVRGAARHERREQFMRKRLVLTATLVAGFLMSGAGATLAVDGIASKDNASVAQYVGAQGTPTTPVTTTAVGGTNNNGSNAPTLGQGTSPGETAGTTAVEPARQVEASGELPFTGYAGMTILLIGLGLLAAGFTLRRGTRHGARGV